MDSGSGDTGSIPGIPSPYVGPPMVRTLMPSLDVPGLCLGGLGI